MPTFVTLYGDLLDRELGSADRTDLFTTVRRKAAINEGQKELNRLTGCFTKRGTISLSDATQEYDLESNFADFLWFADDGIEIHDATSTTDVWYAGDDLPHRDISWMNRYEPNWRDASTGNPLSYYVREDGGQRFLGIYPAPDVNSGPTWTCYVTYVADPADMTIDSEEPYTVSSNIKIALRPWHQALVHFAASKLEALRRHYTLEDRQRSLLAAYVADYLAHKKQRKGPQQVTLGRNYRSEMTRTRPPDPYRWP